MFDGNAAERRRSHEASRGNVGVLEGAESDTNWRPCRLGRYPELRAADEAVDGLVLEAEPYVCGDADVDVTEVLLDDDEFDDLFQEQRGGRVV
ncbi:hypothetical protein ABZ622_27280 [Streptomyces sp. NPDC007164]|uniref:hypothetical protein n=1 Tax=Streptomyces sp. NPDC007164 TaxID=3156918 RepID=UPI0033E6C97A